MIEGTVSTQLARLLAGAAGANAALAAFGDEVHHDLVRVPASVTDALWEELAGVTAAQLVRALPDQGVGLWSHMFGGGENLLDGLRDAARYLPILADPATESIEVLDDGELTTVRHSSTTRLAPAVAAARIEFGLGVVLEQLRRAGVRTVTPVHVGFSHAAPRRHDGVAELFGSRNVTFAAESDSLTFLTADLTTPLPYARPGLAQVLRQHADLLLSAVRPASTWHDRFRAAVADALRDGDCSLRAVAARLALSSRTLQRRLAEQGTTWRAELETVRQDRAVRLLRDTDLTVDAVADRVGYSDARALRRATHRWHGSSPRTVRGKPT
ncbi:helix-turn-helix domain-containing protein [Nonomuraea sp. NPDC049725]|uniref:helix-turn-helix domain-containing protein n=1 Tax=Nonomuraea sp. NPDC049725 TaxID=3154508 RepID=UPI003431943A